MTSKIETTNELRDDKVLRLVIKYSIPAILAMMVTSLYNTVDRAFIGSMKRCRCFSYIRAWSYYAIHDNTRSNFVLDLQLEEALI